MPEATYDNVKNQVFKYVEEGDLEQQFDEQRREIVFVPRA
jgi:type I restriction enzyme S subunit